MLYTVGCSIHTPDSFIRLLKKHNIDVIADVRSVPFSKYTPQFNQNQLRNNLKSRGIMYVPLSSEFGARRIESEAYTAGHVDFVKVKELEKFKRGISRIRNGLSKGYSIALMCTEKDPLQCHRFSLVSKSLKPEVQNTINHILFDGSLETTSSLEMRMLKKYQLEPSLFENNLANLTEQAYLLVGKQIAYAEQVGEASET